MRLATLIPHVPSDIVVYLDECGIRTDTDLLFSPIIEVYRQLPIGSISLLDLERLVARVAELGSAPGISALDMLENETKRRVKYASLTTGATELDNLLRSFGDCRVIEISGDRQSGKTVCY